MSERFDHSNRRRGSFCAAGSAVAVMVGGGGGCCFDDCCRWSTVQPPLDSAVLNNIPVRGEGKGEHFFLTLDKCTTHMYTCTQGMSDGTNIYDAWTVGIFTQFGDIFLYKIVDTSDIYR